MAAHFHPAARPDAPLTPSQAHACRRAATLSRDYGSIPSPGGQLYTPEQDADRRAARDAERMAAALAEHARCLRLAAKYPESRSGFLADSRAALHAYPALAALIGARP